MELAEKFRAGLVNGADDGFALRGHAAHHVDDFLGGKRVEAGGRLVAKEQRRIGEQLGGERQSLFLAAGQNFFVSDGADARVGPFGQAEGAEQVGHVAPPLQPTRSSVQPHPRLRQIGLHYIIID